VKLEHAAGIAALVHALGFDDAHTGHVARHKGQPPGLLVRDGKGRAVEFYTRKQLRELEKDPMVVEAYNAAMPPTFQLPPEPSTPR
jgi:hypothetical protein